MELWRGSLPDFVRSAHSGAIVGDMIGRYYHHHMVQPGESEVRSWKNSLGAFAPPLAWSMARRRASSPGSSTVSYGAPTMNAVEKDGGRMTSAWQGL
jgi:hypothetical protein